MSLIAYAQQAQQNRNPLLALVAEIRVGINTRNVAVSGDGRTVLAGNYLPETLVLLDAADLSLLRVV